MDRREQRLAVAVDDFVLSSQEIEKTRGMGFAQLACWEWHERARMALREAVLMADANGVRCG